MEINREIKNITSAFVLEDNLTECIPYGSGHINDTYRLTYDTGKHYILQKMNRSIFTKPVELMENVSGVTAWLKKKIQENGGKVLGSEEHLISIVGHTALFLIGLGNSTDKALEQVFLPAFGNAFLDDMSLIDIIYLIKKGQQQPLSDFLTERIVFQLHLAPKKRVILLKRLGFLRSDVNEGPLLNHEKHREKLLHGRYHHIHKIP